MFFKFYLETFFPWSNDFPTKFFIRGHDVEKSCGVSLVPFKDQQNVLPQNNRNPSIPNTAPKLKILTLEGTRVEPKKKSVYI